MKEKHLRKFTETVITGKIASERQPHKKIKSMKLDFSLHFSTEISENIVAMQ